MADKETQDKATTLLQLHQAPELLTVVNVWDVISAKVVAAVDGTRRWRRRATPSPRPTATRTARTSRST